MNPLLFSLASVITVSAISLIGLIALSFKETVLRRTIFIVVSVATGALFGDALFHLIPEAIEEIGSFTTPMLFVVAGILGFFILEKFFHWHHHHTGLDETHPEENGSKGHLARLVLTSDSIHNFVDGVIIGASYLVSVELGLATTIAFILHEIPQEIGDFGILIHAGLAKANAILFNFFSALFAIVGTVIVFAVPAIESILPYIVAFAAGNFIYLAGSDLVPELHKTKNPLLSAIQFLGILAGVAAMFALLFLE